MPSARPASLCVFGDSNTASVRKALDAGLWSAPGHRVEFWGAGGPRFRDLHLKNGVLVPGAAAAPVVAQVNGQGRAVLDPGAFDRMVFYGARLNAAEFIARTVQWATDEGWASDAVLTEMAEGWLQGCRAFRIAASFAGRTDLRFVPASFPTDGARDYRIKGRLLAIAPAAEDCPAATRDRLWAHMIAAAARHGVALIPQPDGTVTRGVLTVAEYGVSGAEAAQDGGHKSPSFAALMMRAALAQPAARQAADI